MQKLLALLALLPLAAFGEPINPGAVELSGESSLSFLTSDTTLKSSGGAASGNQQNWDLRGAVLYYVAPNVGVGGTLSYQSEALSVPGVLDTTSSTFALGPVAGLDVPLSPLVDGFARGSVVYAARTMNFGGSHVRSSGWGLGLEVGLKYFLVKQLSIDGGIGYRYTSLTGDTTPSVDVSSSGVGVNLGLSLYFGRT
jgi:hypothetical protein